MRIFQIEEQTDEGKIVSKAIKKDKMLTGKRFFKACWVQKSCHAYF